MRRKREKSVVGFFYVHTWDPFSKYISPSTLKKMKITRVVHESSERMNPSMKKKWAKLFTNLAKDYPRTWLRFRLYYKKFTHIPKEDREYKFAYAKMLKGSGVKSTIEPGVDKYKYVHLFPPFFAGVIRDTDRAEILFNHMERFIRKGEKLAVFQGLAHLNLLLMEAKKRGVKFRAYVLGGIPAFVKGTPLMHIPLVEAYTRYLVGHGRMNQRIGARLKIRSELSGKVINAIFREYPEFRQHPTATYYIASFVTDKILKDMKQLSSIEFEDKMWDYLRSREFKQLISKENLILLGSLLKKNKK